MVGKKYVKWFTVEHQISDEGVFKEVNYSADPEDLSDQG